MTLPRCGAGDTVSSGKCRCADLGRADLVAIRVAMGNHKGGAGKTAITNGLARELADLGRRVLVVDMDAQANATRRLAIPRPDPENPTVSIAEVLRASEPGVFGAAEAAIVPCGWAGYAETISVLPSRFDLENRISEAATVGAVKRLARALEGADDAYDVVLIDCPPSLGHLTQMALAAAHKALALVVPEYDAVEGAIRYRDFIDANAAEIGNPDLQLIGVIVNAVRSQLGEHAFQLDGLPGLFGDLLWEPYIPDRAMIKDAAPATEPLSGTPGTAAGEVRTILRALAQRLATHILPTTSTETS